MVMIFIILKPHLNYLMRVMPHHFVLFRRNLSDQLCLILQQYQEKLKCYMNKKFYFRHLVNLVSGASFIFSEFSCRVRGRLTVSFPLEVCVVNCSQRNFSYQFPAVARNKSSDRRENR